MCAFVGAPPALAVGWRTRRNGCWPAVCSPRGSVSPSPYRVSARCPSGPSRPESRLVRFLLVALWGLALYGLYVALDSHACMSACGEPSGVRGPFTTTGRAPAFEGSGGGSGAHYGRVTGTGGGRAG